MKTRYQIWVMLFRLEEQYNHLIEDSIDAQFACGCIDALKHCTDKTEDYIEDYIKRQVQMGDKPYSWHEDGYQQALSWVLSDEDKP